MIFKVFSQGVRSKGIGRKRRTAGMEGKDSLIILIAYDAETSFFHPTRCLDSMNHRAI
jgi:hypothetical protein